MKKIILLISIILITASLPVFSAQHASTQHRKTQRKLAEFASFPPSAKPALNALHQLPEFNDLLMKVQQEGPVHLKLESSPYGEDFEGFWDSSTRTISVNTRTTRSFGQVICTILFELHNASTTNYFNQLIDQARSGRIDKDAYVEKVEYTEYSNARNTANLIEKGIKMDIFPLESRWPVPTSFSEHYQVQQIAGHSTYIAQTYDVYNPRGKLMRYRGTIQMPKQMSEHDKFDMMRYVSVRTALESSEQSKHAWGKQALQREIANARRPDLLKLCFQGNKEFDALFSELRQAS